MAMKKSKWDDLGVKFSVAYQTQRRCEEMLLRCNEKGLLNKPLSNKQVDNTIASKTILGLYTDQKLLHSSDHEHGKLMKLITCGDHLFPLQQMNDTSEKIRKKMLELDVAMRIAEVRHNTEYLHAYSCTFTVPNPSKGELFEVFGSPSNKNFKGLDKKKNMRHAMKRVKEALYKAQENKKRSQIVVGGDYVGGFYAFEITVNDDNLQKGTGKSIYHPHVHFIMFTTELIDEKQTGKNLYDLWQKKNPHLKLNRGAFDFEHVYKKQQRAVAKKFKNPVPSDNQLMRDLKRATKEQLKESLMGAIKEATMYTAKPQGWDSLYNHEEEWAEVYNSLKGAKAKNNVGIMYEASQFLSIFEDLNGAFGLSVMSDFPDIVTKCSDLVWEKDNLLSKKTKGLFEGRYNMLNERTLTPDEVVYFNMSIIEQSLVSDDDEHAIEQFLAKYTDKISDSKLQDYANVLDSYTFARSIDELLQRLESYAIKEVLKDKPEKAWDIRYLSDSITALHSGNGVLNIDRTDFNNYLDSLRHSLIKAYDCNVMPLFGKNNANNWGAFENFADKQGLGDPNSQYNNRKNQIELNLFVDIEDVDSYLAARLDLQKVFQRDQKQQAELEVLYNHISKIHVLSFDELVLDNFTVLEEERKEAERKERLYWSNQVADYNRSMRPVQNWLYGKSTGYHEFKNPTIETEFKKLREQIYG